MIFVRIESTLRFSEKKAACVDADFCMSTLPWDILETQKMQFWLIACFHRVIFVRNDAYTLALRGLYDVSIASPSYCLRVAKLSRWCR